MLTEDTMLQLDKESLRHNTPIVCPSELVRVHNADQYYAF